MLHATVRIALGNQANLGLFTLRCEFMNQLHEFHEVPNLPEGANVRVHHRDFPSTSKMIRKQSTKTVSLAVFCNNDMPGLWGTGEVGSSRVGITCRAACGFANLISRL